MKKRYSILMIASILIFATACQSNDNEKTDIQETKVIQQADYPYYNDFNALSKKSDLIIKGEITDIRVESLDISMDKSSDPSNIFAHTVYTLEVSEYYKGEGDEILEISQFGNPDANTVIPDFTVLSKGEAYVFFLLESQDYPQIPKQQPMLKPKQKYCSMPILKAILILQSRN